MRTNFLKAVFWDYPQFADEENLLGVLRDQGKQARLRSWMLARFLSRGRVVDTLRYFDKEEIVGAVRKLRPGSFERRKWDRVIEVYGLAGK